MPVILTEAPLAMVQDFFEYYLFRSSVRQFSVFNGLFGCCEKGHIKMIHQGRKWFTPCDKPVLADMLEAMYDAKLAQLRADGVDFMWRLYKCMEPAIFAGSDRDRLLDACSPSEGIADFLVRMGLPQDPRVPDEGGATAIEWAAFLGHAPMVDKLLRAGCPGDVADDGGLTPLLCASLSCNALRTATLLLDSGLSHEAINSQTKGVGITALHNAAKGGLVDVVQLLMQRRAVPDVRRRDGLTPLHAAAKSGHVAVCEALLGSRADVDARDEQGGTAMHKVAKRFNPFGLPIAVRVDVVGTLLLARASPDVRDNSGKTAPEVAFEDGFPEFLAAWEAAVARTSAPVAHGVEKSVLAAGRRTEIV